MRVYLIETTEAQQVQDSIWIECHANGKAGACHLGGQHETLYGDNELAAEARHFAMAMGTLELGPLPKINHMVSASMLHFLEQSLEDCTFGSLHIEAAQFAIHIEA